MKDAVATAPGQDRTCRSLRLPVERVAQHRLQRPHTGFMCHQTKACSAPGCAATERALGCALPQVGHCKSECRTIARACEQIAEELDLTDLSAMLFKDQKRAAITSWMCHESTDVCRKKLPPFTQVGSASQTQASLRPFPSPVRPHMCAMWLVTAASWTLRRSVRTRCTSRSQMTSCARRR